MAVVHLSAAQIEACLRGLLTQPDEREVVEARRALKCELQHAHAIESSFCTLRIPRP